jgi:hypothetical protein
VIWIIELDVNGEFFPAVDIWFDDEEDARDYITNEGLNEQSHRVVAYERLPHNGRGDL